MVENDYEFVETGADETLASAKRKQTAATLLRIQEKVGWGCKKRGFCFVGKCTACNVWDASYPNGTKTELRFDHFKPLSEQVCNNANPGCILRFDCQSLVCGMDEWTCTGSETRCNHWYFP